MSRPFTVVALVAAYNEVDVIAQVVRALIDEGVSVYLIDHHSTDGTAAAVAPFIGKGVIGVETFPGRDEPAAHEFAWERILARKEELAGQIDADWFIHSDADEFRESPWPGETVRDSLQRVDALGYNAVDFKLLNFCPTTADRSDAEDIRSRMPYYEAGQLFDRQQVKCWKKGAYPAALVPTGGHSVQFPGKRVFPVRFLLRHYPIRSESHGRRKIFQERVPRFRQAERAKGWHVQYDDVEEGRSFVRDPADLVRFDADAVRWELWLRHRGVERLERLAQVVQDEADRLADDNATLRAEASSASQVRDRYEQVLQSWSWKLTAPVRQVERWAGRGAFDAEAAASQIGLRTGVSLAPAESVAGYYADGWATRTLRFIVSARRPLAGLVVSGVVPAGLSSPQELRLYAGDRDWSFAPPAGRFEWHVPLSMAAGAETDVTIEATACWQPSASGGSGDTRELAWRVLLVDGQAATQ